MARGGCSCRDDDCPAGADLQAALNAAQPGDVLVLQAGARYVGSFRLPGKAAGPVITIRSSATLPDRRITSQDANSCPPLHPPSFPLCSTGPGGELAARRHQVRIRVEWSRRCDCSAGFDNIYLDRILMVAGAYGQKRGFAGTASKLR
jgi:hypothetical protein